MTTGPKPPRARPLAKALKDINDKLAAIEARQASFAKVLLPLYEGATIVKPAPGPIARFFLKVGL